MNPEVKAKWVAALRSGRYEQDTNWLHPAGGGYCCLGVLCEVAVKEGVIPPPTLIEGESAWDYDEVASSYPPPRVLDWAGLTQITTVDYGVTNEGFTHTEELTVLNDDDMLTFEQIADAIEASL